MVCRVEGVDTVGMGMTRRLRLALKGWTLGVGAMRVESGSYLCLDHRLSIHLSIALYLSLTIFSNTSLPVDPFFASFRSSDPCLLFC
jgi:hypothetical protein